MLENFVVKFFANNRPSPLKSTQKELDNSIQKYLTERNDSTPLETFKENKRFFKGVAATTSQINLVGDKIGGRFTKKGLQSLLSDFDYQGIAVRVDHEDRSLAVGKVFDAQVVTKNGQTRLEAFFWVDGNEAVISKIDSGTYSELSVSFGGFNKLSCGECGVDVELKKLIDSAYWNPEECKCSNGHFLNDPKTNFVNMDNCKPLDEISVVYSGRVRDTSIVKLSKNDTASLQNDDKPLQLVNKFTISGDIKDMTGKTETSAEAENGLVGGAELLKIIQEHAVFKATVDMKNEEIIRHKADIDSLKQQLSESSEKVKQLETDLAQEKQNSQEFSKSKETLDSFLGRVGFSNEANWADKIVAKFLKAEEMPSEAPKADVVFDQGAISMLSKFSFSKKS